MKDMQIASVKLVNSGLKGIVVTYANPSTKEDRTFIDEHTSKKKAPIHEEMENLFNDLRPHILEICGYENDVNNEEGNYNISRTEITGITYNNKGLLLTGKYKVLGGNKTINLVTPFLKDGEEYASYPECAIILDNIYDEVKSYMAGEKTFSDTQLVMKFNEGNTGFDKDAFIALPKEEQYRLASDILEKSGAIIFHAPEAPLEEVAAPESTLKVVKEEELDNVDDDFELEPNTPIVKEVVKEDKAPVQKLDKKSSLKMVTTEGGFKIIAEPIIPAKSTAKKTAKTA